MVQLDLEIVLMRIAKFDASDGTGIKTIVMMPWPPAIRDLKARSDEGGGPLLVDAGGGGMVIDYLTGGHAYHCYVLSCCHCFRLLHMSCVAFLQRSACQRNRSLQGFCASFWPRAFA